MNRPRHYLPHAGAALSALILLPEARAATTSLPQMVYDNGVQPFQLSNGRVNDPDFSIYIEHADNFSLNSQAQIFAVTWNGMYEGNSVQPDNFSLRIFGTTAGVLNPVAIVDSPLNIQDKSFTGLTTFGLGIYAYSASVDSFELDAGTYAISIYNNVADGVEWFWTTSSANKDGSYMTIFDNQSWGSLNSGAPEFAFTLQGAIPEPSMGLLLLLGGGLPFIRRRPPTR